MPSCKNLCDVCKDKDEVKARLTELEFNSTKIKHNNRNNDKDDFLGLTKIDNGLCEHDNWNENSSEKRDEDRRKAEKELIDRQFALRRNQKSHEEVKFFIVIIIIEKEIFFLKIFT